MQEGRTTILKFSEAEKHLSLICTHSAKQISDAKYMIHTYSFISVQASLIRLAGKIHPVE